VQYLASAQARIQRESNNQQQKPCTGRGSPAEVGEKPGRGGRRAN